MNISWKAIAPVAIAVILALTAAIPALYLPMLQLLGADDGGSLWIQNGYTAWIGLAVAVSVSNTFFELLSPRGTDDFTMATANALLCWAFGTMVY